MAADLHIHVFEGITEDDLRSFFSSTLGSKYFNPWGQKDWLNGYKKIADTPNIWVGEVSWLKQAIMSDEPGEFVPDIVASISEIIGEDLPVCDDSLINRVREAYIKAQNHEFYSTAFSNEVIEFLEQHKGKQLFTVSW